MAFQWTKKSETPSGYSVQCLKGLTHQEKKHLQLRWDKSKYQLEHHRYNTTRNNKKIENKLTPNQNNHIITIMISVFFQYPLKRLVFLPKKNTKNAFIPGLVLQRHPPPRSPEIRLMRVLRKMRALRELQKLVTMMSTCSLG